MQARSVGLTAASLARLLALNPSEVPLGAGTTPITGGTASGILWNNAGVLAAGAATLAGGTALAGLASIAATTGAFGGATIGTNALAVMGTAAISGAVSMGAPTIAGIVTLGNGNYFHYTSNGFLGQSGNGLFYMQTEIGGAGGLALGATTPVAGAYISGTPNGGTAAAWKLGSLVTTASVLDTTKYIQLDIGGTLYKLATMS